MPGKDQQRLKWGRAYSLGFEFAAAVAVFALLGYWIDRHYGTDPWGIVICALLGLVGGTYNFVRSALREVRQPSAKKKAADRSEEP